MNIMPCSPLMFWNSRVEEPRVAVKPRPTEAIRYQGATTLRSWRARISRISRPAIGNTSL